MEIHSVERFGRRRLRAPSRKLDHEPCLEHRATYASASTVTGRPTNICPTANPLPPHFYSASAQSFAVWPWAAGAPSPFHTPRPWGPPHTPGSKPGLQPFASLWHSELHPKIPLDHHDSGDYRDHQGARYSLSDWYHPYTRHPRPASRTTEATPPLVADVLVNTRAWHRVQCTPRTCPRENTVQ